MGLATVVNEAALSIRTFWST